MNQVSKCPEPGVYENVPPEDYFAWDAVSNSKLNLLRRSPMHYKHGYSESTPAMRLGSLVHSGVLEPLAIAKRYVFMPDYASHPDNKTAKGDRSFSSSTSFVKSMEDQFRKFHHDKEVVSEEDYNTMVGMATALSGNAVARDLLRDGRSEVSVVWIDEDTGLTCKARADWLRPGVMVDLKTTQDVSEFERSVVRYGYHRQMAFYERGLSFHGIEVTPWIIAVEKSAPYGSRCAPMAEAALDLGHRELSELLQLLLDCKERDSWPGYENPTAWELPAWYIERGETTDVELTIGGETLSV